MTLGVTYLPLAAKSVMFGHTVSEEDGTESSNSADEANYVGYGFISEETQGDDDVFVACILHKVLFTEGEDSFTTEGDSITFSTPTIEGTILRRNKADAGGKHPWKAEALEGDVPTATITGWYKEVYEPTYTTTPQNQG